jgi:SAM-dependent methyltransferase
VCPLLSLKEQIETGKMVCPITHQRLHFCDDMLETADRHHRYPVIHGIPILFPDPDQQKRYLDQEQGRMQKEYAQLERRFPIRKLWSRMRTLGGDYRSREAGEVFRKVIEDRSPEALCLAVGGGPSRMHANLVNLNVAAFSNVDVVGDAYGLPYSDHAVDAVYCEAVLEHLEFPERAVAEIFRVLRSGGDVFAVTPFMQSFHGYPSHYQNFTLVGHQRLFERAGFRIVAAGVCVGPTVAFLESAIASARALIPTYVLSRIVAGALGLMSLLFRPLDLLMNHHPSAHMLASTTYVHARKPD